MPRYAKLIAPDGVRSAEDRSGTVYHVNFDRHVEVPEDMVPALAAAGFTLAASAEKQLQEFPTQVDQYVLVNRDDGKSAAVVRVYKDGESYSDFSARMERLEEAIKASQAAMVTSVESMTAVVAEARFVRPIWDDNGNLLGAERVASLIEPDPQ